MISQAFARDFEVFQAPTGDPYPGMSLAIHRTSGIIGIVHTLRSTEPACAAVRQYLPSLTSTVRSQILFQEDLGETLVVVTAQRQMEPLMVWLGRVAGPVPVPAEPGGPGAREGNQQLPGPSPSRTRQPSMLGSAWEKIFGSGSVSRSGTRSQKDSFEEIFGRPVAPGTQVPRPAHGTLPGDYRDRLPGSAAAADPIHPGAHSLEAEPPENEDREPGRHGGAISRRDVAIAVVLLLTAAAITLVLWIVLSSS